MGGLWHCYTHIIGKYEWSNGWSDCAYETFSWSAHANIVLHKDSRRNPRNEQTSATRELTDGDNPRLPIVPNHGTKMNTLLNQSHQSQSKPCIFQQTLQSMNWFQNSISQVVVFFLFCSFPWHQRGTAPPRRIAQSRDDPKNCPSEGEDTFASPDAHQTVELLAQQPTKWRIPIGNHTNM